MAMTADSMGHRNPKQTADELWPESDGFRSAP